ncbi:MAG: cysteine hydrolase [Coriobacteriia bacterium]|nr:cysteine hydrolase [Coriobacteriia bacterium]
MSDLKWKIDCNRCTLLVIDMQNDFVLNGAIMEVPEAKKQIPKIKELIDNCRKLNIPIIYTVHQTDPVYNPLEIASFPHLKDAGMRAGTDGIKVVSDLAPQHNDYVLQKRRYSAFFQTDLELILRNIHAHGNDEDGRVRPAVDTLIICGTVTNICCESTARDAYYRDYKVVFGSDICSALTKAQHDASLVNMNLFGQVMDCDSIIKGLAGADDA